MCSSLSPSNIIIQSVNMLLFVIVIVVFVAETFVHVVELCTMTVYSLHMCQIVLLILLTIQMFCLWYILVVVMETGEQGPGQSVVEVGLGQEQ